MVVTFITSSSLVNCAKVLDQKRLGSQKREAAQIVNIIERGMNGYKNHPIVKMWTPYVEALKVYFNHILQEWLDRGYKSEMSFYDLDEDAAVFPWWFTWKPLQLSHRASLLRKKPEHYEKLFPMTDELKSYMNYGYIWTNKLTDDQIG
ncbi:Hypothetical protein POVR1_LOCUS263 [uncultured virus]|nr:Hypothetical protein POVR1_LOCUS263 [uncultured virus]